MENQRKLTRKEKLEAQRQNPEQVSAQKNTGTKKNKPVKKKMAIHGIVIAVLGFLLYANSIQNDFALDDYSVIKKNWVVKQGTSAYSTILSTSYRYGYRDSDDELYRPLPLMVFATIWQFFPNNPAPFHLLNVLLFAITGFVLYNLLKRIFHGVNALMPFSAALLFMVHPLHTEVVANIKSIDEILSFLFVLLSVDKILDYIDSGMMKKIVLAWVFFFLAFLCKEGTIVMLVVIPLILAMFTNAGKAKIIQIALVLSSAAFIFLAIRANALGGLAVGKNFAIQENVLVSAPNVGIRLATIFYVLFQYIRLLVLPYPLSCDYSFKQLDLASWGEALPWVSLLFYAGIAFIALRNYKTNKLLSFGILFFLGSIALYSNILMTIGSLFAERFLYTAVLGFAIVIVWLLMKAMKIPLAAESKKAGDEIFNRGNQKMFIMLAILIVPCSFITVSRNADWKDTVTLFTKDVVNAPNSALLQFNFANELKVEKAANETDVNIKNSILDSSIMHYKKALEIYPQYNEVYEQLGLAYYYRGMDSLAFVNVTKAIDLEPGRSTAYNSLGTIYFSKAKDYKKALELYLRSVELNPNYIDGWRNAGAAYGTLGQYDKAIDAFQRVLKLDPVNVTVLKFISQTYRSMGDEVSANSYDLKAKEAEQRQQ
ncbi:MAG: tetratricopeptide repeat protein [Bacteroidota bacterium]